MFNRLVTEFLVFLFRAMSRGRGPRPFPDRIRRVVLVSTTGLGDTVLSTPAILAAKRAWPLAEIFALVHRRWAGLVEACPDLAGTIVYPGKFKKVFGLIRTLKNLNPDLAVILHANDPDVAPLIWLSRPGFLVCRSSIRFPFLLDLAVEYQDPIRHIAEQRLDLLRALGPVPDSPDARVFLPQGVIDRAGTEWNAMGLASRDVLVAVNPGGSLQAKQWPEEHWRELVQKLVRDKGCAVLLTGSRAERPVLERIGRGTGNGRIFVETRSDIQEAAALLTRASVFVGPDSGMAHIAASLGLPSVVLFGPDNPEHSRPFAREVPVTVLQAEPDVCPDLSFCRKKECHPNLCLTSICPERVFEAVDRLLLGNREVTR